METMETMDNFTMPPEQRIIFKNIRLHLIRDTYYQEKNTFRIRVIESPPPLSSGTFQVDIEEQLKELKKIRAEFTKNVRMGQKFYKYADPTENSSKIIDKMGRDMACLGKKLYKVLPKVFREDFPCVIQSVLEEGQGIRLILEASAEDEAYQLLSLPWELFFSQQTQAYLARSPRLLIIRRVLDAVRRSPVLMRPPYHVLHVIADDPDYAHKEAFSEISKMEVSTIKQAIKEKYYGQAANPGSVERMEAELSQKPYQVLHFLGHGKPVTINSQHPPRGNSQREYLKFIGDADTPQWVTGEQLQQRLSATPTVQLIVLNACHGAATAASNIALDLVYSGFPYVVAMQSQITLKAAECFTKAFYEALQEGKEIPYAVALARSRIASELPGAPDWCLPVLYTNVGVQQKSLLTQLAQQIWQWFGQSATRVLPKGVLLSGILFVVSGLFLQLQGITPPSPSLYFLVPATSWVVALPPLIALILYRSEELNVPSNWNESARLALAIRLLEAASIGLGMTLIGFLWFGLTFISSFAFWSTLAPPMQFLLLLPAILLSTLVSYAQAMGHARSLISNANLKVPQLQSGSFFVIIAGYLLILAPLALWIMAPWLIAPPLGNLLIGGMLIFVALLFVFN